MLPGGNRRDHLREGGRTDRTRKECLAMAQSHLCSDSCVHLLPVRQGDLWAAGRLWGAWGSGPGDGYLSSIPGSSAHWQRPGGGLILVWGLSLLSGTLKMSPPFLLPHVLKVSAGSVGSGLWEGGWNSAPHSKNWGKEMSYCCCKLDIRRNFQQVGGSLWNG